MRRGYFTPPVLIILAVIIFAVAILIALNTDLVKRLKKEPSPTPTPSPISDAGREPTGSAETANWKTYAGKYYSFGYPSTWLLSEETLIDTSQYQGPWIRIQPLSGQEFIVISISNNPNGQSLEELSELNYSDARKKLLNIKQIEVDGIEAKRISYIPEGSGFDDIVFLKDNRVFYIHAIIGGSVTAETVDQILSTFQFIV